MEKGKIVGIRTPKPLKPKIKNTSRDPDHAHMLVLDSFNSSGDMIGTHQNLNSSRDLPKPLSGMIVCPCATINLPINLKSLSSPIAKIL